MSERELTLNKTLDRPVVSKRQPRKGLLCKTSKATSSVFESQFTIGFQVQIYAAEALKSEQWSHLKPDVSLMSNTAFLLLQ